LEACETPDFWPAFLAVDEAAAAVAEAGDDEDVDDGSRDTDAPAW